MVKDLLEGRNPSLSEGEIILIFLAGLWIQADLGTDKRVYGKIVRWKMLIGLCWTRVDRSRCPNML